MRAIVCLKYGPPDVLKLQEVEKPIPRDNECLIQIHATTVTSGDMILRRGKYPFMYWLPARIMLGLSKPRQPILGHELSGVIEAVGNKVTRFQPGDSIFASTGFQSGAHAEHMCLPQDGMIAPKPNQSTFAQSAAGIVGKLTALHFLHKGNIRNGQKVLIYGASGSVGTAAIQLAKYFQADVTGVCSTSNIDLIKSLGADHVIDYTQEDFTQMGCTYDIIFDTVGYSSFSGCIRSLTKNGIYLLGAVWKSSWYFRGMWTSMISGKKVITGVADNQPDDMMFLKDLMETGKLKPVIDQRYRLDQAAEAHRYVETGHKKGDVVLEIITEDN